MDMMSVYENTNAILIIQRDNFCWYLFYSIFFIAII